MIITKVNLTNWRNFKRAEASLREVSYILGVNASGKSNFLDVFRFMRDIAKPAGGGLQKAVADRGGLKKLRCLHARKHSEVSLAVEISSTSDAALPLWRYELTISHEGVGAQRPFIKAERVTRFEPDGSNKVIVNRPDEDDHLDPERLTQTALEQIQANREFRELVDHFANTSYLHVVPQLLKYGDLIGGRTLESDPFGQAFMERLAKTPEKTRISKLGKIEAALKKVVPQLNELSFLRDDTGRPHLEIRYEHYRPQGAKQLEDQFSDGTLRLIALFWLLLDGDSLLLLEEPELSLNEEIVQQIPYLISSVRRGQKRKRQVLVTTHSKPMLDNAGIDSRSLVILEPSSEGTIIRSANEAEEKALEAGFTPADVVLPSAQKISGRKIHLELFS
ncbi:AAA family ATPase [Rhizobium sp.]|uniref:AAA family ATPase n=1 Tax=Rhizobium sp. TaxID=391 RepID=UPI000E9268FB|nr:chromosome segregation protein SMC [Rhizobium sp.]